MGAVTIFVIPIFLALVSVVNMFGSITGLNVSEVVLPYDPDITCNPKTFTVVYEKGMEDDDIIWLYFKNSSAEKDYSENHKIRLDCSGRDVKLLNESFWSSDNP